MDLTPKKWSESCPDWELMSLLELHRPKGSKHEIARVMESARKACADSSQQTKTIDKLLAQAWETTMAGSQFVHRRILVPNQLNDAIAFWACMREIPRKEAEVRIIAKQICRRLGIENQVGSWLEQKQALWHDFDSNAIFRREKTGFSPVVIKLPPQLDELLVQYAKNIGTHPNTLIRVLLNEGLSSYKIESGWAASPLPSLTLVSPSMPGAAFEVSRLDDTEVGRIVIRGHDAVAAIANAEPGLLEAIGPVLKKLREEVALQEIPNSAEVDLADLSLPNGFRIVPLNSEPFTDVLEEIGREAAFVGMRRWMRNLGGDMQIVIDPESMLLWDLYPTQPRTWPGKVGLSVPCEAAPDFVVALSQGVSGAIARNPFLRNPPDPLDIWEGAASGAAVATLVAMGFDAVLAFGKRDPTDANHLDFGSIEVRMNSGYPELDRAVVRVLRKFKGMSVSGEESDEELD